MLNFLPRTNENEFSFNRRSLEWEIGRYTRERAGIIGSIPGADYSLRVYTADSVSLFYDPTSTLIGFLDDKEYLHGIVYMGVDSRLSFISYGDNPRGFLSQTITIRNDPDSCNVRKILLEQTDLKGKKILNNEWLVRMGWATLKNTELDPPALWADDNINKLIDDQGRITGYIIHEKGETIQIPNPGEYKQLDFQHGDGVFYAQASPNGDIVEIIAVHKDLNRINPITEVGGEGGHERKIDNEYKNIWKSSLNELQQSQEVQQTQRSPNFISYSSIVNSLSRIFGLTEWEWLFINKYIDKSAVKNVAQVEFILCLLDGVSRQSPGNILDQATSPMPWDDFKELFRKGFVEKYFEVSTGPARLLSDRKSFLALLGNAFIKCEINGQEKTVFLTNNMDPTLYSATIHPGNSGGRANSFIFQIPKDTLKQPPQEEVNPTQFDSGKPSLAIYDQANSKLLGKTIIAIPIFKKNNNDGISQTTTPDTFFVRDKTTSSQVPITSRENILYSNVEKWMIYEYENGKYKPHLNEKGTNIYSKTEWIPTSINEVAKFLRIMSRFFEITHTYGRDDKAKYRVSPSTFCKQLEGMLISDPKQALAIFNELGGPQILATMREVYPIMPTTNAQQEGWFRHVASGEQEEGEEKNTLSDNPDAQSIHNFMKVQWVPAKLDLYILLLSICGAQRLELKEVFLPLTPTTTKDEQTGQETTTGYQCGNAHFNIKDQKELELLKQLGLPVNKNGETFNNKQFTELDEKGEKSQVKGILLYEDLNPFLVRSAFGGRIPNVLPVEEGKPEDYFFTDWFKNLAVFKEIPRPSTSATGYYSICDWILKKLSWEKPSLEGKEGKKLVEFMDMAVRTWASDVPTEIVALRESLADEHFTPILSIINIYFLAEAYSADSEKKALNWFGDEYTQALNKFINDLKEGIKKGDICMAISAGFQESLKYIANKLKSQPNTASQGNLLYAMIKMGMITDIIPQVRPETALHPAAKTLYAMQIVDNLKPKLNEIRNAVDNSKKAKEAGVSGNQFVYDQYGMRLVAMLKYQGLDNKQIQEATGFSNDEINKAYRDWGAYCRNNQITEQQKEKQFISVLQQICQRPTQKTFQTLLKNGLMAGTQIGAGGALGSLHILPFLTILGPVMQAVGFTAISALEASTLSPLLMDQNGSIYWGGALTRFFMNPDTNILASILMSLGVYLTDYCELGSGMFSGDGFKTAARLIDMDLINLILAGMQGGMINMGMGYTSEDTIADIMKPILGVVGLRFHPYLALGFEIAGLVSMLPQMDQFYKEYIWPAAKFTLGAALMGGPAAIITSAIANVGAMTALNTIEQAWVNNILGEPLLQDVSVDFTAILEYVPGFSSSSYDYISNYVTHYVYGMW